MNGLIKKMSALPEGSIGSDDVMLEPYPECVQRDIDDWLDNYHYALCEYVPPEPVMVGGKDARYDTEHYTVTSYIIPGDPEEGIPDKTRYTAIWS